MLYRKLHRKIEIENGCKKNTLKEAIAYLLNQKQDVEFVVKGCKEWIQVHPKVQFEVAFNMYVAALKNPKLQQIK